MGRTLMDAVLRSEDAYETLLADSGEMCLHLAKTGSPDLILVDAAMPAPIDAPVLIDRLRVTPESAQVPLVLVIPPGYSRERRLALETAADDFLCKPFNRLEFLARVRTSLRLKALSDQLDEIESVICALSSAVEARQGRDFEAHTARVVRYTCGLARRIGLGEEEIRIVGHAAILRDLGNVELPDSILQNRGRLEDSEIEWIRRHPLVSEEIISPLRSTAALLPIIRHHHERVDGKGYPDGLIGDQIPLGARIVAIADAYDAMLSNRPYRPAMSPHKALTALAAGAGKQWDSELVEEFVTMLLDKTADFHSLK